MNDSLPFANVSQGAFKRALAFLTPGQRLLDTVDIIQRVSAREAVIPPALALYHSARTHYHLFHDESKDSIAAIYLTQKDYLSDAWPSSVYHELAHHFTAIHYGHADHNVQFAGTLWSILEGENYIKEYNWQGEYVKIVNILRKGGFLPKEYDQKQWRTLHDYHISQQLSKRRNTKA